MVTSMIDKFVHYPIWSLVRTVEKLRRKAYRSSAFQSFRRHFHISSTPIQRPIFIIGTVRSGKTTLAKCLGNHPSIMYVGHELTTEWCDLAEIEIARSKNNKAHCPPYTELEATKTRCHRVRNGFADILASKGGGRQTRFLDDNPHLWNKLSFVRKIFPDAHLIIASRDIRSTVASAKLLWINGNATTGKRYYFPQNHAHCWSVIPPASPDAMEARRIFPGGDIAVLAEYWLHTHLMIEEAMNDFDATVLVKYGALVADADATLAEMCEAIDLSPLRCLVPELDATRNDRWREILTPQEQQGLEAFIESNRARIERLQCAETTL